MTDRRPSSPPPPDWVRAARIVAALEEDQSGRQPIELGFFTDSQAVHHFFDLSGNRLHPSAHTCPPLSAYAVTTASATYIAAVPGSPAIERVVPQLPNPVWVRGQQASLAGAVDWEPLRQVQILAASIQEEAEPTTADNIRTFQPGDESAWLAANAVIFAQLPDERDITAARLGALITEPWFDPAGFFLAWHGDQVIGFHWTKIAPAERVHQEVSGEVYALGVLPQAKGTGLAAQLLKCGLAYFAARGIRQSHLYVDQTNSTARNFYSKHGFRLLDTDNLSKH